jgi:3-oxoadipate enol-lactonase
MILVLTPYPIAYDDTGGSGLPVVLLHGFPFSRRLWDAQVEALRARYRVVCPDLRGHGESEPGPPPARMDDMARDVAALLDHLGVESAVIGGLSMGGYVALAFHRLFRQRVRALVLADTRAGADSEEGRRGRHEMVELVRKEGQAAIADRLIPKLVSPAASEAVRARLRSMIEATPVEGIAGALLGMAERPDSSDLLPAIACPTLVIVGAKDTLTPPDEARAMSERIAGASLVVIPGAGHVSCLEEPALFTSALETFLRTRWRLRAIDGDRR